VAGGGRALAGVGREWPRADTSDRVGHSRTSRPGESGQGRLGSAKVGNRSASRGIHTRGLGKRSHWCGSSSRRRLDPAFGFVKSSAMLYPLAIHLTVASVVCIR